jgi:outer membrane protein TolC
MLLGPIIDFGKNKRRVEIEEQKTQQALYSYENTVLTAFREVEDARVEIDTCQQELTAIERQQAAAKSANKSPRHAMTRASAATWKFWKPNGRCSPPHCACPN